MNYFKALDISTGEEATVYNQWTETDKEVIERVLNTTHLTIEDIARLEGLDPDDIREMLYDM